MKNLVKNRLTSFTLTLILILQIFLLIATPVAATSYPYEENCMGISKTEVYWWGIKIYRNSCETVKDIEDIESLVKISSTCGQIKKIAKNCSIANIILEIGAEAIKIIKNKSKTESVQYTYQFLGGNIQIQPQ